MIAWIAVLVLAIGCTACGKQGGERRNSEAGTVTPTSTLTPTPTKGEDPGFTPGPGTKKLTGSSTGTPVTKPMDEKMKAAYEQFAYGLFQKTGKGETRMISPFSVYMALAMFANGTDGDTLTQMDKVLGLTNEERNAYLAAWVEKLTKQTEDGASFTNANSLWIRNDIGAHVPQGFLTTCLDYYRAAVFSAAMDDKTVTDVNNWVNDNTKGMIKKLLDRLDSDTAMILMNAITLNAKWVEPFNTDHIVKDSDFKLADGTVRKVDMMHGTSDGRFLENELCTGFVKKYLGGEYSYVALLPKEGVTIEQLVDSLGVGTIDTLFANAKHGEVVISMPKYTQEYSVQLPDALKSMGMTDAFDASRANLRKLIDDRDTYVSNVLHKTYISVDNDGTKAAAVTALLVADAAYFVEDIYRVDLNRAFVYMIVDSNGLPIFLGTYE